MIMKNTWREKNNKIIVGGVIRYAIIQVFNTYFLESNLKIQGMRVIAFFILIQVL